MRTVTDLLRPDRVLTDWSLERQLMFCNETEIGSAPCLAAQATGQPWALLIGPEEGFSKRERKHLTGLPFTHVVGLEPRILCTDTAAFAR